MKRPGPWEEIIALEEEQGERGVQWIENFANLSNFASALNTMKMKDDCQRLNYSQLTADLEFECKVMGAKK